MERYKRSFASDNNSIVHPKIMEALYKANYGHVLSYGDDAFTSSAVDRFKKIFSPDCEVYFVFNGTGANVTGLAAITKPYQAIICTETAHINVDECGSVDRFAGCKLLTLPSQNGKLNPEQIKPLLIFLGNQHHSQPGVISISQCTELGTVYTAEELKQLTDFAHANNLLVHMDGARIANAAAYLGSSLKEITVDVGIDVLSFGGTKNGLMFGEAVVFFNSKLSQDFKYVRKQATQLASKMRYIAAQFDALLTDELWLENAKKANKMAELLAKEAEKIPGIKVTQPVQSNGVFVTMPKEAAKLLQQQYFFYPWDEINGEYRWMTSFDTEEKDVLEFIEAAKAAVCKACG